MKQTLFAFLVLVLISSCSNNKKEATAVKNNDWTNLHLKGMVKSLEGTSYTPDSTGKIGEMDSCCIETMQMDDKGYNTMSQTKDSKGNIKSETTITRYEGGQVKEVVTIANGKKTNSFSIDIDKDGKYTGARGYDSAGKMLSYYTDLTEDDYGAVTGGIEHHADSSLKSSFKAENNKGMQVNATAKDSAGNVTSTYKADLDDKGNIVRETTTFVVNGTSTTTITTYKYDNFDDQGNWMQRTAVNEKGKATKVVKRKYEYYK
jgi:hypothetical protein